MTILNTERLSLREFESSDAEFVIELLNEDSFLKFIGDKGVRNVEDANRYLNTGPIATYQQHGFGLFHVEHSGTGRSIGMCGLLKRDDQEYPDIGYAFLEEFTANGYAFEAASAVLDHGHNSLDIETIVAFVDPGNAKSIGLLLKLGMAFVGTTRVDGIDGEENMYRSDRNQ